MDIIPPKDIWVGDPHAPVALVEFGDYESEACARANETVKRILLNYEGRVKFNFRHFPLTQVHQKSHKAAEAAVAAAQHGKFWEMHNLLFFHRRNLGSISLREYAIEAGVKDKNFIPNLIDSVFGWTVRADLLHGLSLGVRDVPVFFINGDRYEGNYEYGSLSRAIDSYLAKGKKKRA